VSTPNTVSVDHTMETSQATKAASHTFDNYKVLFSYPAGTTARTLLPGWNLIMPDGTSEYSRAALLHDITDADALICLGDVIVDEELLSVANQLRVVARIGVGYDNINVPACTRSGVIVTIARGGPEEATAEATIGIMIAASRLFYDAQSELLASPEAAWRFDAFRGKDLAGTTLGLVGYGSIGRAVATRARALGMTVLHHTRHATGCPGWIPELRDLLAVSDVVSLHLPASPENHHLINSETLRWFKHGSVLVNTSRGSLVDESAVASALAAGTLFAVGLDVFEEEPCKQSPLRGMPHTLLLPHIAGNSFHSYNRMLRLAVDSIISALNDSLPPSAINPEAFAVRQVAKDRSKRGEHSL